MQQLSLFEEENTIKTCAFTGHRNLEKDFSKKALKEAIISVIKEGAEIFYCGMAVGFDLCAAELVLSLKKKYPHIRLIACIPCLGQEKYFSKTDQKRYVNAVKKADEQVVLAQGYFNGCMQARDKYMAERADALIAYCKRQTGGTAYTVRIFQKLQPRGKIIFV